MIHCRTLGAAEVTVDGSPAPAQLTWRKHLALLVYLGRSPRFRRTREHLVGLLWPEKDEPAARHSLNEAIRVIRRAGGDDALISEAGQIRLQTGVVCLDVDQLADLAKARDWAGAAPLVGGEFLEGFSVPETSSFEHWLETERHHWRRTSVHALLSRSEELLEQGRLEESSGLAERAARLDGASERAAATVMRVLALRGDRAAALERFDQFAARLRENAGTEPGFEVRALAQRLRENRFHLAKTPGAASRDEARPAPLIGREQELKQLLALWQQCRTGGSGCAAVLGEAGMGKSRLVEELALRAAMDGASIAVARAVESDSSEQWMGLRALARGGVLEFPGVAGGPPEALASMAGQAGEWRERFPGGSSDMPFSRALTEILRVAADERPVLLVFDDAQWMDHDTLLALDAMLRDLAGSSLMLTIAAAPQPPRVELESIMQGMGRNTRGMALELKPLTAADLVGLAHWWLPQFNEEELDRVSRRVASDSAGLPLLAVELFRAVALGLDLHQSAVWPQPTRTLDQTLPSDLPPSVVAAIRVAYRRLGGPAQQVLAAASVLPEPVAADRLVHATGLASAEVNGALDELEWHRWVVAEARGYGFVARIVRATIARDMLTEGQRRRIVDQSKSRIRDQNTLS